MFISQLISVHRQLDFPKPPGNGAHSSNTWHKQARGGEIELSAKQKKVQRKELSFLRCCCLVSHLFSLSPGQQYPLEVSTGFNFSLQDDFSIQVHSLNLSSCSGKLGSRAKPCFVTLGLNTLHWTKSRAESLGSTAREPPVLPSAPLAQKWHTHTHTPAGSVLQMALCSTSHRDRPGMGNHQQK